MNKTVLVVLVLSIFLMAFHSTTTDFCGRGLKGYVYEVKGNQMPSPDEPRSKPKGLKTTLYIYKLTNINQVTRQAQSPFYIGITTELVKEVETNDKGYFKVKLKPGMYSLFVKKDNLFFSSIFDEKMNIHPVEVKPGTMTDVVFNVNYNAAY
jgi:hypothetical protein